MRVTKMKYTYMMHFGQASVKSLLNNYFSKIFLKLVRFCIGNSLFIYDKKKISIRRHSFLASSCPL